MSAAISRSPWTTWISTSVCPSAAVVNTWDFFVGIVVFLSISFVATPPKVSIPSDRGVTSSNNKSLTSPLSTPPWIAAPKATHSSGFISLWGSFPIKFLTNSWTAGTLVDPPTRRTFSISLADNPASFRASSTGFLVSSTRCFVSSSNLALDIVFSKWTGCPSTAVINGSDTLVVTVEDNSFLAFSAASFSLCIAVRSFVKSTPVSFLNSLAR